MENDTSFDSPPWNGNFHPFRIFSTLMAPRRNSTPAIHLKMETSPVISESVTSLSPRTRHGTWSHCQHQEYRLTSGQARDTATQTNSGGEEEDVM